MMGETSGRRWRLVETQIPWWDRQWQNCIRYGGLCRTRDTRNAWEPCRTLGRPLMWPRQQINMAAALPPMAWRPHGTFHRTFHRTFHSRSAWLPDCRLWQWGALWQHVGLKNAPIVDWVVAGDRAPFDVLAVLHSRAWTPQFYAGWDGHRESNRRRGQGRRRLRHSHSRSRGATAQGRPCDELQVTARNGDPAILH